MSKITELNELMDVVVKMGFFALLISVSATCLVGALFLTARIALMSGG